MATIYNSRNTFQLKTYTLLSYHTLMTSFDVTININNNTIIKIVKPYNAYHYSNTISCYIQYHYYNY